MFMTRRWFWLLSEGADLMFSPGENLLFLLEVEEQPQLPQLGAAGLAPQGGQETRLPLGGGDQLLFEAS